MTLSQLLKDQALRIPAKTAFIFQDSPLTFAELEDKIGRCARGLSKLGVKKGTTFGIVTRNCPEFVILVMALSKLGAIAVPINFLEKAERMALILNDAGAVGVLTADEFLPAIKKAASKIKTLKHIYLRGKSHDNIPSFSALLDSPPLKEEPVVDSDDTVMIFYTSGTTGEPKGVMLTHKNLLSNAEQCLGGIDLKSSDRYLCLLPMFHSFAWTTCVLIPIKMGSPCVINENLIPFDPVVKSIWKYKVTIFVAVPQIFSALTAKIEYHKALFIRLVNPIRLCIAGAAPMPIQVQKNFQRKFGIPIIEGYGLTETSPVVSLNPLKKNKIGTVGCPLPGVTVDIRDDDGVPLPKNEVGEIWVKGDNVTKGYYRKPKESHEILTPDGWLKSGDLGKIDEDGYLTIVDRKKDLIIIKGLNVYPQEIENVIAKHKSIKEVAVIGKMDKETGEETVKAFVTLVDQGQFNRSEIMVLCREELAAYKWPKSITVLEEMPKNSLQKILKKDLRTL